MIRLAALTAVTAVVGLTVSVTVLPRAKPGQFETPPPVEIVTVLTPPPEKQPADEKTQVLQEQVKLDEIEMRLRHLTEQAARIERKAEARAEGE